MPFSKATGLVFGWSTVGTLVTCHVRMFRAVGTYSDRKCPGHVEVVLFVFLLAGLNLVLLYIYKLDFIFICKAFLHSHRGNCVVIFIGSIGTWNTTETFNVCLYAANRSADSVVIRN